MAASYFTPRHTPDSRDKDGCVILTLRHTPNSRDKHGCFILKHIADIPETVFCSMQASRKLTLGHSVPSDKVSVSGLEGFRF
ncbi:hypothetical protein AVEN_52017-1 [Araneus ventricosus]|uniref:Uncharacterized protein n=1 Tax=Araneus ventricosus TaxID=182803 RepID=A0A4Y2CGG4_ARAVE|nr:hypothetical protein AVEN_52017-1 [Araneus ventricosus]